MMGGNVKITDRFAPAPVLYDYDRVSDREIDVYSLMMLMSKNNSPRLVRVASFAVVVASLGRFCSGF